MRFGRVALQLPGQGSQYVGMGVDLAAAHRQVRDLYEEMDELLGVPLSRFCRDGPEDLLTRTENAQPAILAHSYAVWTLLPEEIRSTAVVAAGHSLGEFSAYLLAGALTFADAVRLVRRRGELMAHAGRERKGTMAAIIGLDPDQVQRVCESVVGGVVVPANFNAPGQIVVSGDVSAVADAVERAIDAGARKTIPLTVSGAFHSPLMEGARQGLAEELERLDVMDPRFPVVANASAEAVTGAAAARDCLVRQLTAPVRWVECVHVMRDSEPDCWLELGPGRVLSGLMRRIDSGQQAFAAGDAAGLEQLVEALAHA